MPADAFSERIPPQNLEAEQSVLGACLIDKDAVSKARSLLTASNFYAERHQRIWEAVLEAAKGGDVDIVTVQGQLSRPSPADPARTMLDDVGGFSYLTTLVNMVPTTANVEQYAELVVQKAQLRAIQHSARKAIDEAYEGLSPTVVLGNLQAATDKASRGAGRMNLAPVAGRIGSYADQRFANRKLPNADWIPSRFPDLREKCPYMRREVSLLAMPPNSGKTTLALNEALFNAQIGYHVAFFELENHENQVYDKLIAVSARLPVKDIRMGALDDMQWIFYKDHGQKLNTLTTLSLNTETTETMSNIRWQCLRMKSQRGLDLVIIDFLERTKEELLKNERYDQLLGRIVEIAQGIARECNCHVIILAQVDVKVQSRPNPLPGMDDMANSKTNLGSWPDNVITGVQPVKCRGDGKTKPKIWGVECSDKRWKNTLVLNIAKARWSEGSGTIPVYAEWSTGYLGALRRPWPWQKDCPEDQVGQWDKDADDAHREAMVTFRASALAATAAEASDFF